jgi:DNA (cytosine-5)-methyltransferase 1
MSAAIAADLFAGLGGFTEGAEMGGARVIWAANHWRTAVDVHTTNHPHVEHSCHDLMQTDWRELPDFDLLLASPACQGHSNGSQPRRGSKHVAARATAWAVVDCLEAKRPSKFLVENVPPFLRWELFEPWLATLRALRYHVTVQTLVASHCGVPQRRERVIIAGSLRREVRIVDLGTREPPFEPCLDASTDGWRPIVCAGDDARGRMAAASKLHGRCLVQHVTGHKGIPLHEPIRTITTKASWCLVDGSNYRWLTPRELARGMSFPDSYQLPTHLTGVSAYRLIGNAIPPLMAKTAVEQILEAS